MPVLTRIVRTFGDNLEGIGRGRCRVIATGKQAKKQRKAQCRAQFGYWVKHIGVPFGMVKPRQVSHVVTLPLKAAVGSTLVRSILTANSTQFEGIQLSDLIWRQRLIIL